MTKLSDTRAIILVNASQRFDGNVLPLPGSLRGGAAAKVIAVLLKRGLSATLDELVLAAEYVLKEGNERVMLCERGIRTHETAYRFTLDLLAVPALKERTRLPVLVDPSHAPGRRDWVEPKRPASQDSARYWIPFSTLSA